MKKVTSSDSIITVHHYKNILEAEGIRCIVKNEHLPTIFGEVPFAEIWPELWVVNDIDCDRARQLIDAAIIDESPQSPWRCPKCGEENEGQFAACWNCGADNDL